jgi:hypothetical protein
VYEIASGTVRCDFPASLYNATLAFSPDGQTLAASGPDSTVMLWDVGGRLAPAAKEKPSEKDLEELWTALNDPDAKKARPAMLTLAANPKEALALLESKVKPAGEEAVNKLIADLDSDDYKTRENASKELAKAGASVKAALEKTMKGNPTAEQKRRIEDLLANMKDAGPPRVNALPSRAVEVLERLGTKEAERLLKALADGHADAPLTKEAKGALARLAKPSAP